MILYFLPWCFIYWFFCFLYFIHYTGFIIKFFCIFSEFTKVQACYMITVIAIDFHFIETFFSLWNLTISNVICWCYKIVWFKMAVLPSGEISTFSLFQQDYLNPVSIHLKITLGMYFWNRYCCQCWTTAMTSCVSPVFYSHSVSQNVESCLSSLMLQSDTS